MTLPAARFGYIPFRTDCTAPGDRRRFAGWAQRRGIRFEIADPAKSYDVVVLSQAADITTWARVPASRARIVYDLTDSYLALPATDPKALLRGLAKSVARQFRYPALDYWKALRRMCRRADAVICTTTEQEDLVRSDCPNTSIVLDLQDADVRAVKNEYEAHRPFRLVWEGLPANLVSLAVVASALRRLQRDIPTELHVVTDPTFRPWLGRFGHRSATDLARRYVDAIVLHPWSARTLSDVATNADLAIIPIPLDDALARGKPENKLLLFWRMGVPTVTSATPAYRRAMELAGVPLLCASDDDWEVVLRRCAESESLRRDSADSGRALATTRYSEPAMLDAWDRVFASVLATR